MAPSILLTSDTLISWLHSSSFRMILLSKFHGITDIEPPFSLDGDIDLNYVISLAFLLSVDSFYRSLGIL